MMPAPSRHRDLLSDAKWSAAFGRQATIEDVLRFVLDHWTLLQRQPLPKDLLYANKEPKITKFFGHSLYKHSVAAGITGYFVPEAPVSNIVAQELAKTGRTDLVYASDRLDPRLELVFEFKKLRSGSRHGRGDYCTDGIRRFVDGTYSRGQQVAFMVALIEHRAEAGEISVALRRTMQVPDLATILRFIVDARGRKVIAPADRFVACDFETMHARDHAEDCPDLLLGHLTMVYESPAG